MFSIKSFFAGAALVTLTFAASAVNITHVPVGAGGADDALEHCSLLAQQKKIANYQPNLTRDSRVRAGETVTVEVSKEDECVLMDTRFEFGDAKSAVLLPAGTQYRVYTTASGGRRTTHARCDNETGGRLVVKPLAVQLVAQAASAPVLVTPIVQIDAGAAERAAQASCATEQGTLQDGECVISRRFTFVDNFRQSDTCVVNGVNVSRVDGRCPTVADYSTTPRGVTLPGTTQCTTCGSGALMQEVALIVSVAPRNDGKCVVQSGPHSVAIGTVNSDQGHKIVAFGVGLPFRSSSGQLFRASMTSSGGFDCAQTVRKIAHPQVWPEFVRAARLPQVCMTMPPKF